MFHQPCCDFHQAAQGLGKKRDFDGCQENERINFKMQQASEVFEASFCHVMNSTRLASLGTQEITRLQILQERLRCAPENVSQFLCVPFTAPAAICTDPIELCQGAYRPSFAATHLGLIHTRRPAEQPSGSPWNPGLVMPSECRKCRGLISATN